MLKSEKRSEFNKFWWIFPFHTRWKKSKCTTNTKKLHSFGIVCSFIWNQRLFDIFKLCVSNESFRCMRLKMVLLPRVTLDVIQLLAFVAVRFFPLSNCSVVSFAQLLRVNSVTVDIMALQLRLFIVVWLLVHCYHQWCVRRRRRVYSLSLSLLVLANLVSSSLQPRHSYCCCCCCRS